MAHPTVGPVTDYVERIGQTDAVKSIDIHCRVSGYLQTIGFKDGAEVNKGDLLFQIDDRPFRADLDSLNAQVALRKSDLRYQTQELARNKQLLPSAAISQSEYELNVAKQAQAEAAVTAAIANTENARLSVEFAHVTAPIDGRIDRSAISEGNLVVADKTLLTTLVSVDPMYVYFHVDENTWLSVQRAARAGKIKTAQQGEVPVNVALAGEVGFPHEGRIDFAANAVDRSTGTMELRAVLDNPKPATGMRLLTPGLSVKVRIPIGEPYRAVLVPESAVGDDQGQKFLLVVDAQDQVERRPVELGKLEGRLRVITKGIAPEERIMIRGLQLVRPGMKVVPKEVTETPAAEKPAAVEKPAADKPAAAQPATAQPESPSK